MLRDKSSPRPANFEEHWVHSTQRYPLQESDPYVLRESRNRAETCEDTWTYYNVTGKCYKSIRRVNFFEALQQCQDMNSTLITVHNANENDWFAAFAEPNTKQAFFVGLGRNGINGGWAWMDGSESNFTNWNTGEPNNVALSENCVAVSVRPASTWNDIKCQRVLDAVCIRTSTRKSIKMCPHSTYISGHRCKPCHEACGVYGCTGPGAHLGQTGCKNSDAYASPKSPNWSGICEDGWTHSDVTDKCHKYIRGVDYLQALEQCQAMHATLVTVRNANENAWFSNFARPNNTVGSFYIGLVRNGTSDGWEWIDGSDSDFTSWKMGEPNNVGGSEDCAVVYTYNLSGAPTNGWNDANCQTVRDAICAANQRRTSFVVGLTVASVVLGLIASIIAYLAYQCRKCNSEKTVQSANMRRMVLIAVDELDYCSRKKVLGTGAFGVVYAGKWKPPGDNVWIAVAIKAVKPGVPHSVTQAVMMSEANIMANVKHDHLLRLVGVCMATNGVEIVTFYRPLGSLHGFLKKRKTTLSASLLMLYCSQICSAMLHLAQCKIVHRDLATRNVLVRKPNHVEVTDFGLAQMLRSSEPERFEGPAALKWLAYESFDKSLFSEKTDVWSFGVTCWEILTLGEAPYAELGNMANLRKELQVYIEQGHRLKQPLICSQPLYQDLLNCWLLDPSSRPNFEELKNKFDQFCRSPKAYVQNPHGTDTRLNSMSDTETQRELIQRLFEENDIVDPGDLNPDDYAPQTPYDQRHVNMTSSRRKAKDTARKPPLGDRELAVDETDYLMPKSASADSDVTGRTLTGKITYVPVVAEKNAIGTPGSCFATTECEYLNDPRSSTDDKNGTGVHMSKYVNSHSLNAL